MTTTDAHVAALERGVEWGIFILANKDARRQLCTSEFHSFDENRSGTIQVDEASTLIANICQRYELPLPRSARIEELFELCDKNSDGDLQEKEFAAFFAAVVESVLKKAKAELAAATAIATFDPSSEECERYAARSQCC